MILSGFAGGNYVAADSGTRYKFRTFSPEGGLYFDGIKSIKQDADGFIWLALDNYVYRFDGYRFEKYDARFDKGTVDQQWIFHFFEVDRSGRLFLTTNNGLFAYDHRKDAFTMLLNTDASLIQNDMFGNLWVKTDCIGIFDTEKKQFSKIESETGLITNAQTISSCGPELYVGTYSGEIFRFDYRSGKFRLFYSFPEKYTIADIKRFGDDLWVLTRGDGLFRIDAKSAERNKKIGFFCVQDNERVPAKTLYIDKSGSLWVATQRGLYIIHPDDDRFSHYSHSFFDPGSLPNSSVWTIVEDRRGNLWFGTYSGGLCYLDFEHKDNFNAFMPHEGGLNHNVVSGFAEDDDYLWIATEGGGINRMEKAGGKFSYYNRGPGNSLMYDNVKSLLPDKHKNLWIAMYRGGLDCLNTRTGMFKHYPVKTDNSDGLLIRDLRKIISESDSGLWIAYQIKQLGISFFSYKTDSFTHITLDPEKEYIYDICRGMNDDLWAVSRNGLFRTDVRTHTTEKIPLDGNIKQQSVYAASDGNIWIGTLGSGLAKYDIATRRFSYFDEMLKFGASSVFSICEDDNRLLWLGTDNGIFRYDAKNNLFTKFDKDDGVHGARNYPLACMKGKDGKLYFGGTTGFTVFDPRNIVPDGFAPRAVITNIRLDNALVKPDSEGAPVPQAAPAVQKLTFGYLQSNFGFEFSSDNYSAPEKTRFRYRLQGYDDRWTETDASRRYVDYSKVPPGNYIFEVEASKNDGSWSNSSTTIKIRRKPAPWNSLGAYILYFVVFAMLFAGAFFYYDERKKMKMSRYLESIEMKRREEIHQERLRFFTNVSHDFRAPLTLMSVALESLKDDKINVRYYKILKSNTDRLMDLVNELMDFRTVEDGKMKLHIVSASFNDCVYNAAKDFQDYAFQQHIDLKIIQDASLSVAKNFDERIVEKIVMNLINNALKHTEQGGTISAETLSDYRRFVSEYGYSYSVGEKPDSGNSFALVVRDSGIGISSASLEKIFERYYQIETLNTRQHLGSGIGLALVKNLVLLHRGMITIFSERYKGTDILVVLPNIADQTERKVRIFDRKTGKSTPADNLQLDIQEPDNQPDENRSNLENKSTRGNERILVVEDNNDLRNMIVGYLSRQYDILEAPNGMKASEIAASNKIDLIVCDIMMPMKDGISFCREIKNNPDTSHIPFIVLTAKTGAEIRIEGVKSGADIYIEKPFDLQFLSLTIRNIFEQQKNLKKHYAQNFFADEKMIDAEDDDKSFMQSLINIIEAHIDRSGTEVNHIAAALSMSRSKLYLKVKTITGKSVVEFVRDYKIRKAAQLLTEGDHSIREVMDRLGFESQSYFTRMFKEEFGCTPFVFAENALNAKLAKGENKNEPTSV